MAIVINLDVMMAKRKKGLTELAGEVDITCLLYTSPSPRDCS